ncbi:hypothetical protein CRG98_036270 [Punica granatum]|uniref:Uncharacterized protein n=1 Tax=Punica granatum TaxID=22663 RepID=A0A2I0IH71_PUNGR|nr:hypothetical protein CRG98_036270 [Punica granatum]
MASYHLEDDLGKCPVYEVRQTPFSTGLRESRPTDELTAPENGPTVAQGPPGSWNELQMTLRNSTWSPEGRFNGHKRLPASFRGTSTENRDHNDPRTPRDIQGALRKPWSQVPRPSRGSGLCPEATSQRSPTRQKGHRDEY